MKRIISILIIMAAAAGAATAAPKAAQTVQVTASPAAVAQCEFVADVDASARYVVVTPSATPHAERLAVKRIKIKAHQLGADTVYITESTSGNGRAWIAGMALRCEVTK